MALGVQESITADAVPLIGGLFLDVSTSGLGVIEVPIYIINVDVHTSAAGTSNGIRIAADHDQ